MPRIASSVSDLGTPTIDGESGIIRVGNGTTFYEEFLTWNLNQGVWVGKPHISIKQVDTAGMTTGNGSGWSYPFRSEFSPLTTVVNGDTVRTTGGDTFGFQIYPVVHAAALAQAGLKMQEHLAASVSCGDATGTISLNWYDLVAGSTFLSPVPTNFGVQLPFTKVSTAWHFQSTGWQNSPATFSTLATSYPEIYTQFNFSFRNFTGRYRWVARTIGSLGGSEPNTQPPVVDSIFSWHVADDIPQADNSAVAQWSDYSGFNRHLIQTTSGQQPLLIKNNLNGHAIVRFDGVDDWLHSTVNAQGQPFTIMLVLKQYAGGAATQIWSSSGSTNSPLVYHADTNDQVDLWAGAGSDVIYHRGTPWPMPFTCITATFNGVNSTFHENKILKVTGDAGAGAISGLAIGASGSGGANPAHIDVAEVIVFYRTLTSGERDSMVDYFVSKYNI